MPLNEKRILITGGTGSLGKKLVEILLKRYPDIKRLVVFSRDELKQFEMSQDYPESKYPCMRYFLGDIRDADRLRRAFENIDVVIHAAALKQVPAAEYNPFEFIKTNVLGAQNIIDAAIDCGVHSVVALSTDKAAAPINLYGATKLCSDKLFVAANNIKGRHDVRFSVVRYGNVMGSRGSVIPFFMKKKADGVLPITDTGMTRFNISLEEGVEMVLYAVENAVGGEIFVPKIPSYRILDVAKAIAPEARIEVVGIRPGEKMHEEMITSSDSYNTVDLGKYFAILPQTSSKIQEHYLAKGGKMVEHGFCYDSGTNDEWLTSEQLRELIEVEMNGTAKADANS
jgi:UDP-N-acetylglucosamine 4,6-dehydratase